MGEDIKVFDIYNRITRNQWNYCKICLKLENETRLVRTKSISLLLNEVRKRKQEFPSCAFLCYICAARAASAVAFLAALDFACEVNVLFEAMNFNPKLQNQLKSYLNGSKRARGPHSRRSLIETLIKCEANLNVIQERNTFRTSEVLVVEGVSNDPKQKRHESKAGEVSNSSTGVPQEIVISDDEEDAVVYVPFLTPKPIEKLINKQPSVSNDIPTDQNDTQQKTTETEPNITVNNNSIMMMNSQQLLTPVFPCLIPTNPTIIHPIYQDGNGAIIVPTLGGQIDKEGNLRPLESLSIQNLTELSDGNQDINNILKEKRNSRPIYQDDNVIIPNFGGQINEENYLRHLENVTIQAITFEEGGGNNGINLLQNKRNSRQTYQDAGSVIVPTLHGHELNNEINTVLQKKRKSNEESLNSNEMNLRINSVVSNSSKNNSSNQSVPVSSCQSNVDWEDQIPMDVISVMEQTEPTISSSSTQKPNSAICSIENVRSVR